MTLDSHRISPSSSSVGTNRFWFIAIYSSAWVPPTSSLTTICCGDKSSSRQHHKTFWTLIEFGRPQTFMDLTTSQIAGASTAPIHQSAAPDNQPAPQARYAPRLFLLSRASPAPQYAIACRSQGIFRRYSSLLPTRSTHTNGDRNRGRGRYEMRGRRNDNAGRSMRQ